MRPTETLSTVEFFRRLRARQTYRINRFFAKRWPAITPEWAGQKPSLDDYERTPDAKGRPIWRS